MKISTRGRYALRIICDIALNQTETAPVSLKDSSERQNVSMKYVELLISPLVKNKILKSERGKVGGYRLAREPEDITVYDVLKITDGLAPVACLEGNPAEDCEHYSQCTTIGMWTALEKQLAEFFTGITIRDLMDGKKFE